LVIRAAASHVGECSRINPQRCAGGFDLAAAFLNLCNDAIHAARHCGSGRAAPKEEVRV
jgi:hypothetical protein